MKKALIAVLMISAASHTGALCQKQGGSRIARADTLRADSLEHRLIVIDPGFDAWLATQPSRDFYSQRYYESRNRQYVTEWNHRYSSGQDKGIYNSIIDYNFRTDYGPDLNYRLYNYFRYFEQKTGIRLLSTSRSP
ncbi:MAG: DUF6146 family protein [Bacteroidales bacterium]|jgi:hypothetical protein|nr:DUF6146 family protein [Bacteroidales bacterium]